MLKTLKIKVKDFELVEQSEVVIMTLEWSSVLHNFIMKLIPVKVLNVCSACDRGVKTLCTSFTHLAFFINRSER